MSKAKILITAAALCLTAGNALAQIRISADVDKNTVSINDTVTLTVSVSGVGADAPEPQLPSLPNFAVSSSGQSQNISIINGRVSSSLTYQFLLMPRFVGKATINPVVIRYNNQNYQTQPIEITVVAPSGSRGRTQPQQIQQPQAQPQQARPSGRQQAVKPTGKDVFVALKTDKPEAFVNEQINLSMRFYFAVPLLGNPEYVAPALKSFLSEDLPPFRNGEEAIDGRTYYYTEVKTALFGATPGEASVESPVIRYQVRENMDVDPFAPNFFQQVMAQTQIGAPKEARATPIQVRIKPLPEEGKPANFSGAVGRYKIAASVDRKEMKAGEASNLTITIDGKGNLKSVTAPALPDMQQFRTYDIVSSLNLRKDGDTVQGSKTFKTVIVPRQSGKMSIPSIKFSFFDPETKAYREIASLPIEVNVAPGDANAPQVSFTPNAQGGGVTTLGEDIQHLIENKRPSAISSGLGRLADAGPLNFVPVVLFALSAAFAGIRKMSGDDGEGAQARKAFSSAKGRIKEAQALSAAGETAKAASVLADTLNDYLCAKISCPLGGLTLKRILEQVKAFSPSVTDATLSELEKTWEELELVRFAPSAAVSGGDALARKVLDLLSTLEKELTK